MAHPLSPAFAELPVTQPRYLGKDVARVEDPALLTGRVDFTDNLAFNGMAHAAILRSPHAHARITRLDVSRAKALPGVVAVVTGEDARLWSEPLFGMPLGWSGHCLATSDVHFVGEPIAAVAATSRYVAEDALDLIDVEYEPLPVVSDPEQALSEGSPVVLQHQGKNLVYHRVFTFGDVEQAFENAELVVRDDFRWHRASGNPMETCGCIVQWDPLDQALKAWGSFQGTGYYVPSVSRALRIAANKIRLIPQPHGGAFGTKIFPHWVVLMAILSRKAGGRPVKWIEDRMEHLMSSYTHGTDRRYSAEMALSGDGEILAFRVKALEDIGAYVESVAIGMSLKPLASFTGPYRFQNAEYDITVATTNKCPQGSYRGWGVPAHNLALEHCLNLGAARLGLDAVEIRRRNLLRPEEFPLEGPTGTNYDSGDYERTLDQALNLAGYEHLIEEQAQARAQGRLVGVGVYTGVEVSVVAMSVFTMLGPGPWGTSMPESARVRIDGGGKIVAEVTFPWEGQGQHTFVSQLLADYFGVSIDDVQVIAVDSLSAGPGTGPIGSRQAVMLSGAVLGAAGRIKEKLARVAAVLLEVSADDIELLDGQLRVRGAPDRVVTLQQVLTTMLTRSDLLPEGVDGSPDASFTYNCPDQKLPDANGKGRYDLTVANAAHVLMVEVDRDTGQVDILKYVIADDCGVRLHPAIVEGMVQGGLAQGIGHALLEEHSYGADGQYLTASFMDYLLPTIAEVPMTERTHTETPSPFTPLGVKGTGEGAILSTPAAVFSAINDALAPLGVRCTTVPATPSRLLKLIQQADGGPG